MKRLIFLALAAIPNILHGQINSVRDTVRVTEVVVSSSSSPTVLNGFSAQKIDSSVLKYYQLENIADVLSENTTLFVKNYGPGAIATLSFRGTGSGHTQLLWNDMSINSPMLGQADLSLVPAGFTDEIRVLNGAASMLSGNSGIGGTVNFATRPQWTDNTGIYFNSGAGSFDSYSGMLKVRTGSENFQSVTRAFMNSSSNDFRYLNDALYASPVYEKRRNAAVSAEDFMQEFYFRGERSVTSASVWYSRSDRQLPSNMLTVQAPGAETQTDESLRTVLSHDRMAGSVSFSANASWFSDRLLYINKPAAITSDNRSDRLMLNLSADIRAGRKQAIKSVFNTESDFVRSVNYSSYKSRNITSFTLSDRISAGRYLGFSLLLRELATGGKLLLPDFTAGADLKIMKSHEAFVRVNFSRSSKLPTMNDLYWNPGGNTSLRNEYSYTGELAFDMKAKLSDRFEALPSVTLFSSKIKDMILWLPGEFSYWVPGNFADVRTSGVETTLATVYKTGSIILKLRIQYSLTFARSAGNPSDGQEKQLIYVPYNQLNSSFSLESGIFFTSFVTDLTGRRFTDAANTSVLPAYTVSNLTSGIRLGRGSNRFSICAKSQNIFSAKYQSIAWYPMPGRSVTLSVIYQFN
jgi:vitamin B12 transporter